MSVKTWKILDWGPVPDDGTATVIPFSCPCGLEAELPVSGRPLAITPEGGVIFDLTDPPGQLPASIQCRRCARILTDATGVAPEVESHVR